VEESAFDVRWLSNDCLVDIVEANVNSLIRDPNYRANVINPTPVLGRGKNHHSVGDADSVSYGETVWSRGNTCVRGDASASALSTWRFVDTESLAN